MREAIWAIDRDQAVWKLRSMEQLVDASLHSQRVIMWLIGSFAGAALVLAAIGIYGVISFVVSMRTNEVGIRMALGARRGEVVGLILRRAAGLAVISSVIGVAGAIGAARLLANQLFGVTARDPLTLSVVPAILVVVALIAAWIPARRASRLDPVAALRAE
jgi:ABC-type antimicrobial peptide transport system permease subunit